MTIHVIRHASAVRRSADRSDIDRPLDSTGFEQATRIADALANAALDVVISSPSLRCRQTLEPLAAGHELDLDTSEALWEGQGPRGALAIVQRLAAADANAALCSHGDIIPAVLDLLALKGVPLEGVGCAKGSIWTLDIEGGRVVAGRYRPQP